MLNLFNNQKDDDEEFTDSYKTESDFLESEDKQKNTSEHRSRLNRNLIKSIDDSKFDGSEFD